LIKFREYLSEKYIVAYHGSANKINQFSGISYFTPQRDAATGYAKGKSNGSPHYLYKVKFKLNNPILFKHMWQIGSLDAKTIETLKKQGHDGAYYDGSGKEPIPEYVSFYPEQIKILDIENLS